MKNIDSNISDSKIDHKQGFEIKLYTEYCSMLTTKKVRHIDDHLQLCALLPLPPNPSTAAYYTRSLRRETLIIRITISNF